MPATQQAPAPAPALERIELDEVDKENRGWLVKYVEKMQARLEEEQASEKQDAVMLRYFENEIANYQELLART